MEALQGLHGLTGTNLASDPSLRMNSRPKAVPPGKGRAHDDFGSDLKSPSNRKKLKQGGSRFFARQSSPSSDERDEIDCLSQESKGSADAVRPLPSLEGAVQGKDGITTREGIFIRYADDYKPKKKLGSFKKNKPADANKPSSDVVGSSTPSVSSSRAAAMRKRPPSPKSHNGEKRLPSDHSFASFIKDSTLEDDAQETPRPRPRPRRLHKNDAKQNPAPAPFLDMLPGLSTQDSQEPHWVLSAVQNKPLSTRNSRSRTLDSQSESVLRPAAFPSLSPTSTPVAEPPKLRPQAFPAFSPPGSQNSQRPWNHEADEQEEVEPEGSFTSSKSSAKPFPLSDQFFNSSQTSPVSKRSSKDDENNDFSPRKKRKCGRLNEYDMYTQNLIVTIEISHVAWLITLFLTIFLG
jgi:hypothetical protein